MGSADPGTFHSTPLPTTHGAPERHRILYRTRLGPAEREFLFLRSLERQLDRIGPDHDGPREWLFRAPAPATPVVHAEDYEFRRRQPGNELDRDYRSIRSVARLDSRAQHVYRAYSDEHRHSAERQSAGRGRLREQRGPGHTGKNRRRV